MSNYDAPLRETYRFAAATISAAAVVGRFVGPVGKRGRVANVSTVVTTGVTDLAGTITVGNNGAANPVTITVPVSSANAVLAIPASGLALQVEGSDGLSTGEIKELVANTLVEVAAGGECTAGAADIIVTVDWY